MSAELPDTAVVGAEVTEERHAMALRIALAAAGGFTLGHLLGWDFSPVHTVGAATFVVVLSLGPSLIPQDSARWFRFRDATVIVASLYTIGVQAFCVRSLPERRANLTGLVALSASKRAKWISR